MENSEIPRHSLENLEELRKNGEEFDKSPQAKAGSSRSKTREMENSPRKNRARSAKKENRNEVSVEGQACEEQYLEILKELQSQHFIMLAEKLKDPSKCEGSPFCCELCAVKLANIESCQNHVRTRAHKKLKKSKGELFSLSRVSPPSELQILALSRLLDSAFLEYGLCPVKDLARRQEVAKHVGKTVHSTHPECSVSIYGSSFTGFGLKESDVNLDLVIPDEVNIPCVLLSILDLLQKDVNYCDVKSEFDAKVPRILFKHVSSGLDCELSPGNGKASKTSCLLKKYSDVDPRVRTLVVGLRYWARVCGVDCQSEGGLPGYSFALMVIQFLQETKPPVLPRWTPSEVIYDDNTCASEDFISYNKDEIGSLWFQLFRFYCIDFEIPNLVISVREPMPFSREAKKWGYRRIAVEDPFSTKRNVASSLSSDRVFEYFFTCWKNSFRYFSSLPSCPQKKPVAEVPNNNLTMCAKQTENDALQNKNCEGSLVNEEEAIFEMEDLDHTIKQMQCMKLSVDGASQTLIAKDSPSLTSKDDSDSEDEIEITLSESDSEEASELRNQTVVNKTTDVQDVVYRFDAQVFRGNNHPVKTCCYCKEDDHTKVQCPELRKPTLRALPQMTPRFGGVLNYVCKTCRADFEFEKSEVGYREKVLQNLEEYIHSIFPGGRLFLFGSSKNGFGFRNSDIDICMTLDNQAKEEVDAVDVITKLAKLLRKHKDCANVLAITTAKVPIVKFFLRSCKREADISLYNTLALENTAMLATYAKLDDRVTTLGYTVKVFAKVCDIGDASKGSLSSYAYILMLLHYLQQCKPPVIPILQSLYTDNKQPEKIIDGWNCWFCRDLMEIKSLWNQKEKNTLNAGLLWYGFLRYYTEEFDFEHDVVCCRRTKRLTKFEKMWTKHVFAIEDPFNLDHNLGAGVTRKMASYITSTLIKGRERFGFPCHGIPEQFWQRYFFDVYFLTDGYEAPTDRNCRICGKIGHIAKECPHSKSNRRAEQKKEADERKAVMENGEKFDLSRKSFNAGPSLPTSAPKKQEQKRGEASSTPLPAAQVNTNVTSISRSQPDSQFVSPPVKEGHSIKPRHNPENSPGMPPSKVPHTLTHVHNLPTDLTNKNVALTGAGGEIIDPNRTHTKPKISQVASAVIINETGNQTSLPGVLSPGSSNNDCTGNQNNSAASATPHTSSSVALPHSQRASSLPNHPQGVKPPPGFYIPEGTRQVPHASSTGYPHSMAGGMSPSPPVNISPVDTFEGQPIVLNTPQHQPGMFSPQSGQFAASPSLHEIWMRQQEVMLLNQPSPPVRPLVPYPLTPEVQVPSPLHQWRSASDSLPMQHVGSPVYAQQRLAEHNHQIFSRSPPNISRSVLWPVATNSPPSVARGQQFQGHRLQFPHVSSSGMPAPQHMTHPRFSQGNSHGVLSPQQIAQQLQFTHSPGMPSPVLGSPPQHTLQRPVLHQEGQGNYHGVLSPQQIAQQLQFTHSPGMPSPVIGSPPQHTLQRPVLHQEGQGNSHGVLSPQQIAQQLQFTHSPGMPSPVLGSPPQHTLQQPVPQQEGQGNYHGVLSPQQIAQQLQFTHSPGMPSPVLGSPPQHMLQRTVPHKEGQGNSHGVLSPQQIAQKLQFTHSPGMSSPVLGSPPQHTLQQPVPHQEGLKQPAFGTHMTGDQFIHLMRVVEDESKKSESILPTKFSSDEFEPKEFTHIPPKDVKVAKTPEEHKLLTKLSKVKSLWEGSTSPGVDNSCPNPDSIDTGYVTLHEQSDMVNTEPDAKLSTETEPWRTVPDKDSANDEDKTAVHTDQEEKEKSVPSSITDESARLSKALDRNDFPSAGNVASDEKLQMPSSTSENEREQTSVQAQLTATVSPTPKQLSKPKPTRRGGRGRKPRGSRQNETDKNAVEKPEEKAVGDRSDKQQKNYDDFKVDALKASPSAKKPRGEAKHGDTQDFGRGSESRPREMYKQKGSPAGAKDGGKKRPERNKQCAREAGPANSPGNFNKGDKGGASKQKDSPTSVNYGDKKGPEASTQSKRAADPANSPGYSTKGGKGGTASRRRRRPQSHTKSEGADGEKEDSRQRSNSAPEKQPSKNS